LGLAGPEADHLIEFVNEKVTRCMLSGPQVMVSFIAWDVHLS
jgi:hypothetical protein